jgi:hypothetical protein
VPLGRSALPRDSNEREHDVDGLGVEHGIRDVGDAGCIVLYLYLRDGDDAGG